MDLVVDPLHALLEIETTLEQSGRSIQGVDGLVFAIVFAETGQVVAPLLPGGSLLFAAGALAAAGHLSSARPSQPPEAPSDASPARTPRRRLPSPA